MNDDRQRQILSCLRMHFKARVGPIQQYLEEVDRLIFMPETSTIVLRFQSLLLPHFSCQHRFKARQELSRQRKIYKEHFESTKMMSTHSLSYIRAALNLGRI